MSKGRGPDFIGLGAQKSGTSWIYSCLYEHPAICIPVKEIHFFSAEDNWRRGREWYERHFARCAPAQLAGEFSTTYLAQPPVAERIRQHYPGVRLIACLRNPVDRAFSNFLNDLQAGTLPPDTTFEQAVESRPEYLAQGCYATQLQAYRDRFPADALLVLVYDDLERDPARFIASVYRFLGVDDSFVPAMLHERVNVARVPRFARFDQALQRTVTGLRRRGLDGLVWRLKRAGLPKLMRGLNARPEVLSRETLTQERRARIGGHFTEEIDRLEAMLARDLAGWQA